MNWDYIADATDPRGPGYAATRRAAKAARATQQITDDLLELQLAQATGNGEAVAARIQARRQGQAHRKAWWKRLDLFASAILLGFLVYCFMPTEIHIPNSNLSWHAPWAPASNAPQSAIMGDAPSSAQTPADDTPAPVSPATAQASQASDAPTNAPDDSDPAVVEQRGVDVLHAAGMSDAQINARSNIADAQPSHLRDIFEDRFTKPFPGMSGSVLAYAANYCIAHGGQLSHADIDEASQLIAGDFMVLDQERQASKLGVPMTYEQTIAVLSEHNLPRDQIAHYHNNADSWLVRHLNKTNGCRVPYMAPQ